MFIEDKKDKVFIPQTQNTITANDYNQIKNEIQNAIELAGMTPEKDVIQFPQALKTLTQQSGAEEVAKIEAAGQEQLQAVNTAGSTQTAAVNEAGSTQTEAVNAAGQTQLNAINTAGAQAVQDAQDAANTATSKAAEAAGSATEAAGSASAAASSASAASGSASTATTQASNAADSAELAQKWATQTTAEVVSGQGYGAKYYADQAADSATSIVGDAESAAASATAAAGSASAAAQSAQAAASSASLADIQNKITNCLTKIPQDIKLSVSSGTLMLGSGSKAYSGSGSVINITQNLTASSSGAGSFLVFAKADASALVLCPLANCSSGTSDPQTENTVYYNTSTKTVSYYASANTPTEVSLPLGVCTASGQITSVDHVFNGFGFIGSVPFVLPGVACLRTGGRNADGTLTSLASSFTQLIIPSNAEVILRTECYLSGNNNASMVPIGSYAYNEDKNNFINISDGALRNLCFAFSVTRDDTGRILSLTPQDVFRAVDYGDVYKRTTVYSSEGSNATITFPTPIKVKDARYLEVVYTARGKSYVSIIPSVFAPLGIVVGSLNWGGDQTDRDYDCVMNVTCAGGYITAFTSLGRDIYIKRVDVVDYLARS